MKVFILGKRDANTFFEEIESHSKTTFEYGFMNDYKEGFDALLIHWPEAIFNWEEINDTKLNELQNFLNTVKKSTPIFHCVHNLKKHGVVTDLYLKLYDIVWQSVDVFVHLGAYSKELLKNKFPESVHTKINHPLYKGTFPKFTKTTVRKELGISRDTQVVFIPGKIRTINERRLLIKGFKKLETPDKLLISHRFFFRPFPLTASNRPLLKRLMKPLVVLFDYLINRPLNQKQAVLKNKNFLSTQEMGKMMTAADVIVVPRLQSLNSGMVYLALTYNKPIVAPLVGNIKEIVETTASYGFDPNKEQSFYEALKKAFMLGAKYLNEDLNDFMPENCAQEWDLLFLNKK
jgi:hypothetical protein